MEILYTIKLNSRNTIFGFSSAKFKENLKLYWNIQNILDKALKQLKHF